MIKKTIKSLSQTGLRHWSEDPSFRKEFINPTEDGSLIWKIRRGKWVAWQPTFGLNKRWLFVLFDAAIIATGTDTFEIRGSKFSQRYMIPITQQQRGDLLMAIIFNYNKEERR